VLDRLVRFLSGVLFWYAILIWLIGGIQGVICLAAVLASFSGILAVEDL